VTSVAATDGSTPWRRRCVDAAASQMAGVAFAHLLEPGDVVLLEGELGAGKTTFTQGVGRGLGVSERVTSPTFTLVREHRCHNSRGITTLHHADVYRIESIDEVFDLAVGELVEEGAVALIEWGELAAAAFGERVFVVRFGLDEDEVRTLEVSGALAATRAAQLDEWARS
jgi:tRNA threonylcarbamoyladenosine biosynthesis protein TsaE